MKDRLELFEEKYGNSTEYMVEILANYAGMTKEEIYF